MSELPDIVTLAIPGFIALILIELLARRTRYETRDTAASLLMGLGNTLVGAVTAGMVLGTALFLHRYRLFDIGYAWWAWLLCLIVDDLDYYIFHRMSHRCRWFWASHVVHHSSQHYNLSTALRQTWTGRATLAFLFHMPAVLIGFPPTMVLFCGAISLIYQFWIHTEAIDRCPRWFEAIFNTPSHHRVHHATNPDYLDANYAGILIIWDRLFGSFAPERADEPCHYGLVHNLGSFNPLRIAFHEWYAMGRDLVSAKSWRARLLYLFAPPGWSEDGSRETSAMIKARAARLKSSI
jgi:sterol desaturase/sphingolipid hydroxylase (fatty acid hydroxylase superfamily)